MAKAKRQRRNSIRTMATDSPRSTALESLERAGARPPPRPTRTAPERRAASARFPSRSSRSSRPGGAASGARARSARRVKGSPLTRKRTRPPSSRAVVGDALQVAAPPARPRPTRPGSRARRAPRPRRSSTLAQHPPHARRPRRAACSPSSASPRAIACTARARRVDRAGAHARDQRLHLAAPPPPGRTGVAASAIATARSPTRSSATTAISPTCSRRWSPATGASSSWRLKTFWSSSAQRWSTRSSPRDHLGGRPRGRPPPRRRRRARPGTAPGWPSRPGRCGTASISAWKCRRVGTLQPAGP